MSPSTETQLLSMISLSHHEQICLTRLRFERYLVGENFKAGKKTLPPFPRRSFNPA